MALERNVSDEWSSPALTLTADTLFQCQAGAVYLDIGAGATEDDDGLMLIQDPRDPTRDSVTLPAGIDVRWRRAGRRSTKLYYAELG